MVQQSARGRASPGPPGPTRPAVALGERGGRPRSLADEAAGSVYDRFWRCLSGRRPAERWNAGGDVAPLGSLRTAFGLAEESDPPEYGAKADAGAASAAPDAPGRSAGAAADRPRSPGRRA